MRGHHGVPVTRPETLLPLDFDGYRRSPKVRRVVRERARPAKPLILPVEAWMDLRRYKPLRDAGATWREIADEVGLGWRTVKRYLSTDAPSGPPRARSRRGTVARKIDVLAPVVDAWLAADPRLRASVIHERLVAEYGFDVPPRGAGRTIRIEIPHARAATFTRPTSTPSIICANPAPRFPLGPLDGSGVRAAVAAALGTADPPPELVTGQHVDDEPPLR